MLGLVDVEIKSAKCTRCLRIHQCEVPVNDHVYLPSTPSYGISLLTKIVEEIPGPEYTHSRLWRENCKQEHKIFSHEQFISNQCQSWQFALVTVIAKLTFLTTRWSGGIGRDFWNGLKSQEAQFEMGKFYLYHDHHFVNTRRSFPFWREMRLFKR